MQLDFDILSLIETVFNYKDLELVQSNSFERSIEL